MIWPVLIFITAISWGLYDIMYERISTYFSPIISFLVIALIQVVVFGFALLLTEKTSVVFDRGRISLLVVTAILLSVGNATLYFAFKTGAPVSVAVPALTVGIAVLGALWGVFVAKETVNPIFWMGLSLSIIGVVLMGSRG